MQHKLFVGQNNAVLLLSLNYNYSFLIQPTNSLLLPMTIQSYHTSNENKDKPTNNNLKNIKQEIQSKQVNEFFVMNSQ